MFFSFLIVGRVQPYSLRSRAGEAEYQEGTMPGLLGSVLRWAQVAGTGEYPREHRIRIPWPRLGKSDLFV